jgi:hypothetical protein
MKNSAVWWLRHRAFWIWAACAAAIGLAAACKDASAPRIIPWSDEDSIGDSTKTGMLIAPAEAAGVWV